MKKRIREPKSLLPLLASVSGPALIKHLASCNTSVRSQSLRLLQSWLQSQTNELSNSDIKKLWKGLFYCLWHSDKTPNQVALIDRLTSLFVSLQPSVSFEFFRGFLVTLRREWPGIDRLRLDKFYLLIRRFMKALFELMRLRKWDVDVLREYFMALEKDGFLVEDKLQGNGVSYHVVSVFLEELKGVGFPARNEVVGVILGPFFGILLRSKDRVLLGNVKSCVFDELVKVGKHLLAQKQMGVDTDEKDGAMLLGFVALRMGLTSRFYEVGSSVECIQRNRRVALGLHEEFLKLKKELESSGIEISLPEYSDSYHRSDNGDTKVPQLIPIDGKTSSVDMKLSSLEWAEDTREDEGKSDDRTLKKCKKEKKGMDADDKKAKRKKKKKEKRKDENMVSERNSLVTDNGNVVTANGLENCLSLATSAITLSNDLESLGNAVVLNETVISNLQKQFEKVVVEAGSCSDDSDYFDTSSISPEHSMHANKRKRTKRADGQEPGKLDSHIAGDGEVDAATKSVGNSVNKVRFAMKNNLVWKTQNPMPPESLRLPPSVILRGSALKKGVPPGPIIETRPVKNKQKKKGQKRMKSSIPVMKRQKKVLAQSV